MNNTIYPPVSLIVIGKNEEKNLHHTFRAINKIDYPKDKLEIIYVDTESEDKSVTIANQYADKVYEMSTSWPTAGLARNKGLLEAKYDIVHFIDGDIRIDKDYLKYAVSKINESGIDAVFGHLEEVNQEGINKTMLNSHWKNRKEGYANATGGGGTYLKKPLMAIHGYDERIKRGQETEMGIRFNQEGYKIWMLDVKMGTHNYNMKKASDFIKKQIKEGKNLTQLIYYKGNNDHFQKIKKTARNNIIINSGLILAILLSIILKKIILLIAFVFLFILYFFIRYVLIKKYRSDTLLIHIYNNISRPFLFWGQLSELINYLFYSTQLKQKLRRKEKLF